MRSGGSGVLASMTPEVALTAAFIATAIALVHAHGYTKSTQPEPDRPERVVFVIAAAVATAVPVWSEAHVVALIVGVALQGCAIGIAFTHPKHVTATSVLAFGGTSIAMLVTAIVTGSPSWRIATVGTTVFFLLNGGAATVSVAESATAARAVATSFL